MASNGQLAYRLNPAEELVFKGPFDQSAAQRLRIENTGDVVIGFKVKTTTPKKFSVKPNIGSVEPKSSIEIAIAMPPFVYDFNDRSKHKFMVQVVEIAKAMETHAIESLIKDYEKSAPSKLRESKLRVSLMPSEQDRTSMTNGMDSARTVSTLGNNTGDDVRRFETEISNLRHENAQLKEETAYQRKQITELERQQLAQSNQTSPSKSANNSVSTGFASTAFQKLIIILIILLIGFAGGFYTSSKK